MKKSKLRGISIRLVGPILTASWVLLLNTVNADATSSILIEYIEATIIALILRFGLDLGLISNNSTKYDRQKLALLSTFCGLTGALGGFYYSNYFIAAIGLSHGVATLALLLRLDGKIMAGDLLEYCLRPALLFLFAITTFFIGNIDLVLVTNLHAFFSLVIATTMIRYVFGFSFSEIVSSFHHLKGIRVNLNLYLIGCFGALLARLDILLAEKVLLAEYTNYYAILSRATMPIIAYVNVNYWYALRGKAIQHSTSRRVRRLLLLGLVLASQVTFILLTTQITYLPFIFSSVIFCYLTYLMTVFWLGPNGLIHIEKHNGEGRSKAMSVAVCIGIALYILPDAGETYFIGLSFSLNMLNYLLVEYLIIAKERPEIVPR